MKKKTSDKQIYYAYDLSLLSLVQLWNIDLAFLTCYVLEHQYPTMYICWHFLVHPLFFGTQHIFFSGHPPLSLFVHPAVQWVSLHLRSLTTQTSFAVEVETYSFRKAFPLNLKDDMAILFLQALLWNIMTDCDSCQVVEKVSDSGDTFSYYAQAIGVFLLVLSVVGAWICICVFSFVFAFLCTMPQP